MPSRAGAKLQQMGVGRAALVVLDQLDGMARPRRLVVTTGRLAEQGRELMAARRQTIFWLRAVPARKSGPDSVNTSSSRFMCLVVVLPTNVASVATSIE